MSLYDNDIDKLKQWNQADNNDVEKVRPRSAKQKFLYSVENFNGDLTQFKDIDKANVLYTFDRCDNLKRPSSLPKMMVETGLFL